MYNESLNSKVVPNNKFGVKLNVSSSNFNNFDEIFTFEILSSLSNSFDRGLNISSLNCLSIMSFTTEFTEEFATLLLNNNRAVISWVLSPDEDCKSKVSAS